jgi:hypothetical protein
VKPGGRGRSASRDNNDQLLLTVCICLFLFGLTRLEREVGVLATWNIHSTKYALMISSISVLPLYPHNEQGFPHCSSPLILERIS